LGCTLWAAATINQDAWNRLSPDIQKAFAVASKETSDWLGKTLKNNYTQQIADLKAKKVLISTLSDNDKKKWADALPDSPAEWARSMEAKGLPGFEVWKQFKALAEQSGHRWPREFGLK
jgi:TRAP-type C4-dicarboxylate transport system substrate-binding protein